MDYISVFIIFHILPPYFSYENIISHTIQNVKENCYFFVFLFIQIFETLFHICECFLPFFVRFFTYRNSPSFKNCLYFFFFYCFLCLRQFYSPSSNSTNHTKVFLHPLDLDKNGHLYKYLLILCDN